MKQTRTVRQSIVVSAVLLSVLFFLPLAVIEPFRAELFGRETPVEESEPEVGKLDGEVMLQVLNGGYGGGEESGNLSDGGSPSRDAGVI